MAFGEPFDWTQQRQQDALEYFPTLEWTDPDNNMSVDMFAFERNQPVSAFSQSAMNLAAHNAKIQQAQQQEQGGFWQGAKNIFSSILELDRPLSERFGYKFGGEGAAPTVANLAIEEATRPSNILLSLGGLLTGGLSTEAAGARAVASATARAAARNVGSAIAGRAAAEAAGAGLKELGVENPYVIGGTQLAAGLAGGIGAYQAIPKVPTWFEAANTGLADQKAAIEAAAPEALQIGRGAGEGRVPYYGITRTGEVPVALQRPAMAGAADFSMYSDDALDASIDAIRKAEAAGQPTQPGILDDFLAEKARRAGGIEPPSAATPAAEAVTPAAELRPPEPNATSAYTNLSDEEKRAIEEAIPFGATEQEKIAQRNEMALRRSLGDVGPVSPVTYTATPVEKITQRIKDAEQLQGAAKENVDVLRRRQAAIASQTQEAISGAESFKSTQKALEGMRAERPFFEPMRPYMEAAEIDSLHDMIRTTDNLRSLEKFNAQSAFEKILDGVLPQSYELAQLYKVMPDLAEEVVKMTPAKSLIRRGYELTRDIMSIPRALMASGDLSYSLRQAIMSSPRNPGVWLQTVADQMGAFRSAERAAQVMERIDTHPLRRLLDVMGVDVLPIDREVPAALREEAFFSKLAERIPGVARSERAYTVAGNSQRSGLAYNILERRFTPEELALANQYAENGYKGMSRAEVIATNKIRSNMEALGSFVNQITGRGDLKSLEKYAPELNALFFSPRNFIGRVQANLSLFSSNPMVRREAAENLISFYGTGVGILGMAKMAGMNVGTDPNSADFGKIILPSGTRIDIWGGNAQMMRFVSQLVSGEKTSSTGVTSEANRMDTVLNFLRNKLAPVPAEFVNVVSGEDPLGKPVDAKKEALRMVTPLWIQDLVEASQNAGIGEGTAVGVGSFFGLGNQSYRTGQQKVAGGRYQVLQGEDQLDAIPDEAWRIAIQKRPELGQYRSYGEWKQQTEKELLQKGMEKFKGDELRAQKYATDTLDKMPISTGYNTSRAMLKNKWVAENPNTALRLYQQEMRKKFSDRNPTYVLTQAQVGTARSRAKRTDK